MPTHLITQIPVGVRYMLMSALGFALMSACVKLASAHQLPLFEIVAARALVSLLLSYADVKRKRLNVWGNNRPLLIARGVIGTLNLICVYFALATLPLAEATMLQYLYPAFTALLALLFLKERIHRSTLLCILFCMLGLWVIVGSGGQAAGATSLPLFSVAAALVGSFGSAVAYIMVKRLSSTEDSSVIIFYFPLIALPFSLLLLGNDFVRPDGEELLLLLLIGLFTQVGQVGLTKAMHTEVASKAAAYSYVQVIFSILLGWAFFAEIPSLWTWLGGGLIMLGALINSLARK